MPSDSPTQKHKQQSQPRDARIISLILQSLGVEQFDPKVVPQLLEFAHRYTTDVIQDALVYAEHANKNDLDLDDIQLAIQGRVNHSFTNPPPKELLLELAEEKNKIPLPLIPEKYGIRLPADKHCLTGLNFSILPDAPPPPRPLGDTTGTPSATDTRNDPMDISPKSEHQAAAKLSSFPLASQQSAGTVQSVDDTTGSQKRGRDAMEDDDYDF
ncbi:transcription initiation factor IID, 31kD subunit-domain-containing protein [Syncephalastrum racemosum]|uniref:Transcription initiation factor IID, 31kD subunit-domain-containing protein n=1 Tax=Syncephalastrum racemosum TaxID=13706 RepID=A0A1X2HPC4_SYNRA|nr:transcription initiation factor IID, 31kD subunit-domain-containing protein [Syncephalastrum racemosum]